MSMWATGWRKSFWKSNRWPGGRHVAITERRTAKDRAFFIKGMLDERYPQAIKVRLVMDNLNTHTTASLTKPSSRRKLGAWPA